MLPQHFINNMNELLTVFIILEIKRWTKRSIDDYFVSKTQARNRFIMLRCVIIALFKIQTESSPSSFLILFITPTHMNKLNSSIKSIIRSIWCDRPLYVQQPILSYCSTAAKCFLGLPGLCKLYFRSACRWDSILKMQALICRRISALMRRPWARSPVARLSLRVSRK